MRAAVRIAPGAAYQVATDIGLGGRAVYLYRDHPGQRRALPMMFWKGVLHDNAVVDANPDTKTVRWAHDYLTEKHIAQVKELLGSDHGLDDVKLDKLRAHATTRDPASLSASAMPGTDHAITVPFASALPRADSGFNPCQLQIAQVVMDAIMLIFGVGELIKTQGKIVAAQQETAEALGATGLAAAADGIQKFGAGGAAALPTNLFDFLQSLSKASVVAIAKVILSNLNTFDKVLYGGLFLGRIGALAAATYFGTPATAAAILKFELAVSGILLLRDVATCYKTCNFDTSTEPTEPTTVQPGRYITDRDGHFLVPVESGNKTLLGFGGPGKPMDLSRHWKLTFLPGKDDQVTISSLASSWSTPEGSGYYQITAPPNVGDPVTLEPSGQGGMQVWIVRPHPSPMTGNNQPGLTPGYILDSSVGLGALYLSANKLITKRCADPSTEQDHNFYVRDFQPRNPNMPEQIEVGWEFEMVDDTKDWAFWNVKYGPVNPLPIQSGTLRRTDDPSYWSVVAMCTGGGADQVIAHVRCWTDAAGRHIQAAVDAGGKDFGKVFAMGLQDPEVSVAQDTKKLPGLKMTAWIVDNFESEDDGDG